MKIQILNIVFFLFISSAILAQDEFTLVKKGQKAPGFTYKNREGATVNL